MPFDLDHLILTQDLGPDMQHHRVSQIVDLGRGSTAPSTKSLPKVGSKDDAPKVPLEANSSGPQGARKSSL